MEWTKIRSLESKILYFFQWKIVLNKDSSKEGFKVLTIHVKWLSRNFCVNTMLLNQTGLLRLGFTYVNLHHAVLFPNRIFFSYFGHHQIRRKQAAPVFRATNDSFIWNHVTNLGLYEIWKFQLTQI